MLDILEDFVASQNYKRLRLDGSTPSTKRTELVDEFNAEESNIFVFLLSTKAGGLGLNLVAATVVVIFDPNWNPAHDMQAHSMSK
jgi:SNF2 family DNA or RNA helicase